MIKDYRSEVSIIVEMRCFWQVFGCDSLIKHLMPHNTRVTRNSMPHSFCCRPPVPTHRQQRHHASLLFARSCHRKFLVADDHGCLRSRSFRHSVFRPSRRPEGCDPASHRTRRLPAGRRRHDREPNRLLSVFVRGHGDRGSREGGHSHHVAEILGSAGAEGGGHLPRRARA